MSRKFSYLSVVFFLIPIFLFLAQVLFTTASESQIRWEEVGTGIRKPYWFANREINSGIDSNIGFDMILSVTYTIFGVDLYTGKYVRLALQLMSLFSLAYLLRKYLGEKLSIVPLLTIGLSPTLLFFVSFQQQYGLDLQFLPIVIFLILSHLSYLRYLGWALAMVAWMSYPTFGFYLPALVFLHLEGVRAHLPGVRKAHPRGVYLGGILLSFLLPLVLGFIWIQNRQLLIFDPATQTGIFRGGGGKFFQEGALDLNISNLFSDLFSKGISYNFDPAQGEFSLIFPILTLILTLAIGLYLIKKKSKSRLVLLSAWLTLVASLVIYLSTSDPTGMPGIRRVTGALASFYALFVVAWWAVGKGVIRGIGGIWVIRGILGLLLLHHLIVYPINLIHLKTPSRYQEINSFPDPNQSPFKQYQNWISQIQQKDVYLSCQSNQPGSLCKFSDLYSIMVSACYWNHLKCHTIYGKDPYTDKFIPLSRDLWNTGYLER